MKVDDELIPVIDRLINAVNVCYAVENATYEEREKNYNLQYPFATGYSRSAMNQAIDSLSWIVSQMRESD